MNTHFLDKLQIMENEIKVLKIVINNQGDIIKSLIKTVEQMGLDTKNLFVKIEKDNNKIKKENDECIKMLKDLRKMILDVKG